MRSKRERIYLQGIIMLKKYVGTKEFYKTVLMIAVPIMIQNGFTNLVNMVDNVMVGRVGTDEMNGVAIINQLLLVYNLTVFGAVSGAGIFTAQFFGKRDLKGVKNVFRIKMILCAVIAAIGIGILIAAKKPLIISFLHSGGVTGSIEQTYAFAESYLKIMLIGLVPYTVNQCITSTMRETSETLPPMYAGILAVIVNLSLNGVLIYGLFGVPALGVRGAAIATVISRFAECVFTIVYANVRKEKNSFISGVFSEFKLPKELIKGTFVTALPLMANEMLWSMGMTMLAQCYSTRGLATVGAVSITNTVVNLFNIVFISLGTSISIIIGQKLGAGRLAEAKEDDTKLIAFTVTVSLFVALLMAAVSPLFPKIYNTTDEVKLLAKNFILISAAIMPFDAYLNAAYFTLRSGGKTGITFIFDSGYVWAVAVPLAWCLSHFTTLPPVQLYFFCQLQALLKSVIGFAFVKSDMWIVNMVESK